MKRLFTFSVFFAMAAAGSIASETVRYVETSAVPVPPLRSYITAGHRIEFLDNGQIMMSGHFSEVNGVERESFARLAADGKLDASYIAAPRFIERGGARAGWLSDGAGRVTFFDVEFTAPSGSASVRRLAADGSLDTSYQLDAMITAPVIGERPYLSTLIAGAGGRMLIGGRFDKLGGVAAKDWALLRADGTVDPAFQASWTDGFQAAVPLDDGRWIVVTVSYANDPTRVPWAPIYTISRVLADGSRDATFTPHEMSANGSMSGPHAFAFDDSGRLVFAEFVQVATDPVAYVMRLGRLDTDGKRDKSFGPVLPDVAENQLPYFTSAGPAVTGTAGESQTLVYLPPRVRQIAPDGSGNLLCVAPFKDASYGGIARVVGDDAVGKSGFSVGVEQAALWLRRDATGRWWGEFAQQLGGSTRARPLRLLASGAIDPGFFVATLAAGSASRAFALPSGAVALEGHFDLAGGLARPGIAIVEGNGSLRAMSALPWRARLVSVLDDSSLLLTQAYTGAIILASDESGATPPGTPRLARLFPDGTVLGLLAELPTFSGAQSGWLDREGRVFLVSPGAAFREGLPADLVRVTKEGALDPTFLVSSSGGSAATFEQACADAEGNGAWALQWQLGTRRIVHLDANGTQTHSIALRLARDDNTTTWIAGLSSAPDGLFVAGRFDTVNGLRSPGVVRVRSDGTIDATWGGGLRAGSAAYEVQRFANGVVLVGGELATSAGAVHSVLLDANGLPISGVPATSSNQISGSADGVWVTAFQPYTTPPSEFIWRWRAESVFDPPFTTPIGPVHLGDTVTLRVDWIGVPLMGISWWRDGVLIAGANGPAFSFVPTAADDGAVFFATLTFEGGSVLSTRSWRLVLDGPHARMTNGSIRAIGGVGEQTIIIGCDLAGIGRDAVLVRGLGPALGELGVGSAARSALVSVLRGGVLVAPPGEYVSARNFPVGGVHPDVVAAARSVVAYKPDALFFSGNDQMLYPSPGSGTLHVHVAPRVSGDAGVLLGELFSISNASGNIHSTWLRNFSGRAPVRSGGGVLIGGFVIEGDRALRVLVRGVGPGLARFGVAGASRDPRLTIFSGATAIASNDNWDENTADAQAIREAGTRANAFPLDAGALDAAAVVSLAPGAYTVVISADASAEGVALLEVYALD